MLKLYERKLPSQLEGCGHYVIVKSTCCLYVIKCEWNQNIFLMSVYRMLLQALHPLILNHLHLQQLQL